MEDAGGGGQTEPHGSQEELCVRVSSARRDLRRQGRRPAPRAVQGEAGTARAPRTPPLGTDAPVQGRGHLSAAKLKEQLACDTGPDGAGLERGPEFLRLPPGATSRAELGKARPGPHCSSFREGRNGTESVAAEGVVGSGQKLDRLASLQMRGEKQRLEQQSPPRAQLSAGAVPLETPGLAYPAGETPGRAGGAHLLRG